MRSFFSLALLGVLALPMSLLSLRAAAPPRPGAGNILPAGALQRFGSMSWRHSGIRNSALSGDGKLLATVSPRSVVVWDLTTGSRLRQFRHERGPGFSTPGFCFSPDGRRLALVYSPSFACVWDLTTGKELRRFEDGSRGYSFCRFSADSKELALIVNNKAGFHDLQTGKITRLIPTANFSILSPDARFFVRVDEKAETHIGDVRTGKVTQRMLVPAAHNGGENGLAFTPDGRRLALVAIDRAIEVRDFPGGQLLASFPLPPAALRKGRYTDYRIGISPDARVLLLATKDGVIHRWDVPGRKELPALSKHPRTVANLHVLPDNCTLMTTCADGLIRRFDLTTGLEMPSDADYHGVVHAALSADGRFVVAGDERGRLDVWEVKSGRRLNTLTQAGIAPVKALAFSPDGRIVAVGLALGRIHLLERRSGRQIRLLASSEEKPADVMGLFFSPDGRHLAVQEMGRNSSLLQVGTGKVLWRGRHGPVAFSPDGTTLAAVTGSNVFLLDAASGKSRRLVAIPEKDPLQPTAVQTLAWSPDGRLLAVGLADGEVALCDPAGKARPRRFRAVDVRTTHWNDFRFRGIHRSYEPVRAAAFTPDGRYLLTGGNDGSVRLFEAATMGQVLRYDPYEEGVKGVACGAGGSAALSWGPDGQVFLWGLRPPPPAKVSHRTLRANLAGAPALAYQAVWALAADPKAPAFLASQVAAVPAAHQERVARLITDLDSDRYPVREAASKELAALGEQVLPALEKGLAAAPSPEARRRLRLLLRRLEGDLSPEQLRQARAVQALERAGTAAARNLLRRWASGAPAAALTQDAAAALRRLEGK
jgi:WD40 repeat protein